MTCKTLCHTGKRVECVGMPWDLYLYFTAVSPDKVKVKLQNVQMKTVEIKAKQVQTETMVQQQGTCKLFHNSFHLRFKGVLYFSPPSMTF